MSMMSTAGAGKSSRVQTTSNVPPEFRVAPKNVLSQIITTQQLDKLNGVRIRSALEPNIHVTSEDNGIGGRRQSV